MTSPLRFKNEDEVKRYVEQSGVPHVKVGVTDMDGILRGKYLARDKFLSVLPKEFGFCDVIVGWDSNDQLYDNVTYTGWHTAYPDAMARIVPETGRAMPFEKDIPFFLAELTGKAEAICPRGLLRRVLAKAETMGFAVASVSSSPRGASTWRPEVATLRTRGARGAPSGRDTLLDADPGHRLRRCPGLSNRALSGRPENPELARERRGSRQRDRAARPTRGRSLFRALFSRSDSRR